ncbi:protein kinase domain-containing protein [Sorangium sp. So ce131]|uniref:serine/threonine-protein kinase n=1 Tax=Sorangium sp. So ce131 TaxID=3133282 RepID=UPI003F630210
MDDERAACERRVGTTLRGKWTIDRLLGIGGMAAVYAATHKIGRREAIKILHPEVARSKDLRARFEREAQAVNRFRHPGVVEIRDIDTTDDGAPFLVMELLEGESLADRLQRLGNVETGEVLRLMDELLDVLGAAHDQGIIHRDIKLDNLFVENGGRLKVLDFGIARMRDGVKTAMRTRTGATLGTVSYMAPEQVRGISVDHRADLFAVGATMFRLIAKRRIHEARTESELLVKMATMAAPPLASVAPETPQGLCLLVDRALAFDRERRYPDARTMQADMRALQRGEAPPFASARFAAGDLPWAGAPQVPPMLAAASAAAAPAEPPPRPPAPSGSRPNELGPPPGAGSEPNLGSSGTQAWDAPTMAAPGPTNASVMDPAQAPGSPPGMAHAGSGAPNGPPSALYNTGASHAGPARGAPAALHNTGAPYGAPASLHNTGAPYGAPASLHNTGASHGAPAALHNTGASPQNAAAPYGAPASLHNTGAPYGAPASLHNTGASLHNTGASYGAPASLHNTGASLHNTGASYGAPASLHNTGASYGAPAALHNTGASLHNTGASHGAPVSRHSASMPQSAPASLHNTGASHGAPASMHSASMPYGEQPAASWAPRRAQDKRPQKLVILLAIGSVALVIASAIAAWMALRDEPQSDALRGDLLPAQSASAKPVQIAPSDSNKEPPREEAQEKPEAIDPNARDELAPKAGSPPPAKTYIIEWSPSPPKKKPRRDD